MTIAPKFSRLTMTKTSLLLMSLAAVTSCKKNSESKVKTLDQFAGSNVRYSCKGTYTDNDKYMKSFVNVKTPEQTAAIKDALSAVSPTIKSGIFDGPIKPKMELTDNVGQKCLGTTIAKANSKQMASLTACPAILNGKATIYLDSKPENIRSGLVRGLAYYFVHIHSNINIEKSSASRIVVGFANQGDFSKNNKYLGAMIFLDEVASKGNGAINVFDTLLPKAVLTAKTKSERDAAFMDPRKNFVGDRDAFVGYFTAELIDSTFCSDASRQAFTTAFPKTAAFFGATPAVKSSGMNLGDASDQQWNEEPSGSTTGGGTTGGGSSGGSSGGTPPIPIEPMKPSDGAPSGFSESKQKMYLGDENTTKTTSLYQSQDGKSQAWQGEDGKWRQSPIPTKQNNDLNVNILDKSPIGGNTQPTVDPNANPRQQPLPGNNPSWNEEPVNGKDPLRNQQTWNEEPTNNIDKQAILKTVPQAPWEQEEIEPRKTQPIISQDHSIDINEDNVIKEFAPKPTGQENYPTPAPNKTSNGGSIPGKTQPSNNSSDGGYNSKPVVKPTRECTYWNYWCMAPWQ